jgi:hypothetical protein
MIEQEKCSCIRFLRFFNASAIRKCGRECILWVTCMVAQSIALVANNCHIRLHPFAYCNFPAVATSKQQAQDTDNACINHIESHMM